MAKNNQRDPNLRAATVARVNQLVKGGLTKASAFERISAETGRAKDAVQMLYYRAVRAGQGAKPVSAKPFGAKPMGARPMAAKPMGTMVAPKASAKPAATSKPTTMTKTVGAKAAPAPTEAPAAPIAKRSRSRRRRGAGRRATAPRPQGVAQTGDFPALLNGIASAINSLLKHVEKTVEENKTLKEQAGRLQAITSLIRGR